MDSKEEGSVSPKNNHEQYFRWAVIAALYLKNIKRERAWVSASNTKNE